VIEKEIKEKEDWLNEHGEPNFGYLKSLASDGSPEALEKLNSIADDLNVERDRDISSEDLVERIRSVTSRNGDDGQGITS
jgi:hypothetical protein